MKPQVPEVGRRAQPGGRPRRTFYFRRSDRRPTAIATQATGGAQ